MNELALFAGAGGGILGGHLLGWRTVCAVEWEPYAACVLAARQNDGLLPHFPIWDDVQTFDGKPWRGIVDVVSGGFPCQDISAAGKGAGIEGERSGMWKEMARIIGEVRPKFVFVENSPMLTSRGLGTVLGDLAALGFNAEWGVISAADTGAPHLRERIWVVGYTDNDGQVAAEIRRSIVAGSDNSKTWQNETRKLTRPSEQYAKLANPNLQHGKRWAESQQPTSIGGETRNKFSGCGDEMANPTSIGQQGQRTFGKRSGQAQNGEKKANRSFSMRINGKWPVEPDVGRVANGVAARVDRLKAIGNGQVSRVAATAFELLQERLNEA